MNHKLGRLGIPQFMVQAQRFNVIGKKSGAIIIYLWLSIVHRWTINTTFRSLVTDWSVKEYYIIVRIENLYVSSSQYSYWKAIETNAHLEKIHLNRCRTGSQNLIPTSTDIWIGTQSRLGQPTFRIASYSQCSTGIFLLVAKRRLWDRQTGVGRWNY